MEHFKSTIEDADVIPRFHGRETWEAVEAELQIAPLLMQQGEVYTREHFDTAVAAARQSRFATMHYFTRSEGLREQAARLFLQEATSLAELENLLEHISSLKGSQGTYTSAELIDSIHAVLNRTAPLETITRAYGLRETISRILNTT